MVLLSDFGTVIEPDMLVMAGGFAARRRPWPPVMA